MYAGFMTHTGVWVGARANALWPDAEILEVGDQGRAQHVESPLVS